MNATQNTQSHCAGCGQSLPVDAVFCPGCGKRAPQTIVSAAASSSSLTPAQARRNMMGMILGGVGFVGLLVLLLLAFQPSSDAPRATGRLRPVTPAAPTKPESGPLAPPAPTKTVLELAPPSAPPTPAAEPGVPASFPVRILEDKRLGFQIEIPQGWVTEPEQDGYALSPADDSPDTTEISGTLTVVPRRKGETLQDELARVKEELRELTKLVMEEEETLTLAGHPALRLKYHHFQLAAEEDYVGIRIVVERDTDFIHLALSCTADRRQRYEPILNRLISSLRSTAPAP